MMKAATLTLVSLALCVTAMASETERRSDDLRLLVRDAVSMDDRKAAAAIAALSARGPSGLEALLLAHSRTVGALRRGQADPSSDEGLERRLLVALDRVARQKDAYASGLYWYTDLEEAKAAARATGNPILSLRLLGRLDEEMSCANSRFFRTVLYANAAVSEALRSRFVLHWRSVRPAPRMTVDFGDGRKLERTVTGNSIHYVVDTEGRVVDALPGLYGPKAFLAALKPAEDAFHRAAPLSGRARERFLARYHSRRRAENEDEWVGHLRFLGVSAELERGEGKGEPAAFAADRVAMTKRVVERPLLRAWFAGAATIANATDELVAKLAALHPENARLDERSRALIRRKTGASEVRVEAMLRRLEKTIAEDTVRNEYRLHGRIHGWLRDAPVPGVEVLNERVYAELFLTPSTDPWLGLAAGDAYAALDDRGLVNRESASR